MVNVIFHPMSEIPDADESDASFSKTVLIYNDTLKVTEFGYYDFEEGQWSHFGNNTFLLKCWCYIPDPAAAIPQPDWAAIAPKGYKKHYLKA
jgi:hypothetical protein